ncbi:hypothetical protein BC835DRAFT_1055655 [Cytidiella melzeri]|nr:hypothetical protein BC835DRAFT_1055655 [Cytidiella melzeri]
MTSNEQQHGMQKEQQPAHEQLYAHTDPTDITLGSSSDGHTAAAGSQHPKADSNSSHDESHLPTIIFAIPFPPPRHGPSKQPVSPYLLYALPRAPYTKPKKDENGKDVEKEGVIKKAERKWQEEIAEGDKIRKGMEPEAGTWKTFKGKAVGVADTVIRWLPNSRIEALGRVPPQRKLGELTVLYPNDAVGPDGQAMQPEFMKSKIEEVLKQTQKQATYSAVGSAFLLPVTLTIDFFVVVPIFLFETNLAYFASQFAGRSKVSAIAHSTLPLICTPTSNLSPVSTVLSAICFHLAPGQFPVPDERTRSFTDEKTTEEVRARHILDREKVAEDLGRCCRKAAKEYVKRVT